MSCIRRHFPEAPSEGESPIEKLVGWQTVMEGQLPYGNITTLMHARNAVGAYRDKLAPWEWFRCPQCGGRGLWVNRNGENRYCPRCSETGILLACEQGDSGCRQAGREKTVRQRWHQWALRRMNPRATASTRRRS
jgi:hypothetical protein